MVYGEEVGVGSAFEVQVIRAIPKPTAIDVIITVICFALVFGVIYFAYKKLKQPHVQPIEENIEFKEEDNEWRR